MDFTAINKLHIKEAFSAESKFSNIEKDEDYLLELFEHSKRHTIFVHDSKEKGYSVFVTETKGIGSNRLFVGNNTNLRDIFLFHIDGVLYKKNSKCDCALLSEKEFVFIEFKTLAYNNNVLTEKDNIEKAYSQLLVTIQDFSAKLKTVGIDLLQDIATRAFIVFDKTCPRNNSTRKAMRVKFLSATKGIELSFENSADLI